MAGFFILISDNSNLSTWCRDYTSPCLRSEILNNILLLLLLYHIKVLRVSGGKYFNPGFRLFIISISLISVYLFTSKTCFLCLPLDFR